MDEKLWLPSTSLKGQDFQLKWTKGLFDHVVSTKGKFNNRALNTTNYCFLDDILLLADG